MEWAPGWECDVRKGRGCSFWRHNGLISRTVFQQTERQSKQKRINWCIRDLKSLQKRSLHRAGPWVADWQDKRRHYNLSSNTCSTVTSVHRDHEWTRRCFFFFLLTSAKQRSRKRSRTQTPVRCICSWLRNNTEVTHLRRQRRRITRLPTCACFWRHLPTNQPRASMTLWHCGKRSLAG